MATIAAPTPTTTASTNESGETTQFTEWTVGAYTLRKTELRKAEEPGYIHWGVSTTDHDLPSIHNTASYRAKTPEFGVNWSAWGTRPSTDARAYAAQLAEAADAVDVFNAIVAAD